MKKNNKGFSLVELSIVLIIIALLIAGIISGRSLINNAKLTTLHSEMQTLKIAISSYINDRNIINFKNEVGGITIQALNKYGYLDEGSVVNAGGSEITTSASDNTLSYFVSKYNGGHWFYGYDEDNNIPLIIFANIEEMERGSSIINTLPLLDKQLCETFKTRFERRKQIEITCEYLDNNAFLVVGFPNDITRMNKTTPGEGTTPEGGIMPEGGY